MIGVRRPNRFLVRTVARTGVLIASAFAPPLSLHAQGSGPRPGDQTGDERRVPAIHASTLSGTRVDLPDDLGNRAAVVLIGFSKASGAQVSEWGRRLANDEQRTDRMVFYEVAELEEVPRLLRGLVTKQIKSAVSAKGQTHFITLSDHAAEWKQAAGYSKPDQAYVVVFDGSGRVRFRLSGNIDELKYSELKKDIEVIAR